MSLQPEDKSEASENRIAQIFQSLWAQFRGFFRWVTIRRALIQVAWAIVSIFLALLVASLIMIATGYSPLVAYSTLLLGAALQPDLIFWYGTPLILTGLSVALAFQAGLFNIGAEGQLYIGSMAATVAGFMILLPVVIHPIVALLIGGLMGGLWGLIPGLLKAYRGAHEVVTTMMMTFVATLFTQWLAAGPLREPGQVQPQALTPLIFPTAYLPKFPGSPYLHLGFVVGILCVIGVWILLKNTVLGYELRAVGKNATAAEAAGINPKKMIVIALFLSGCLAGLAGAVEIQGYYHRFRDGWSSGLGFDGITVAVLGANSPIGVFLAAIFFGFLRAGGTTMQVVGNVPAEMIAVIQGLVVLFVAAPKIVSWLSKKGNSWAQWIMNEPKKALPLFIASIIAIIGSISGLMAGAPFLGITLMSLLVFANEGMMGFIQYAIDLGQPFLGVFIATTFAAIIFGIIAIFVFYSLLMVRKRAVSGLFVISIAWIAIGIINGILLVGTLLIPLVILGIIGIVLSVWAFLLVYRQGVTFGGKL